MVLSEKENLSLDLQTQLKNKSEIISQFEEESINLKNEISSLKTKLNGLQGELTQKSGNSQHQVFTLESEIKILNEKISSLHLAISNKESQLGESAAIIQNERVSL